jgi:uncharacterized membrane protein
MNCNEASELFAAYPDMPKGDKLRIKIEEHIRSCTSCAEEFAIWEESSNLIYTAAPYIEPAKSMKMSNSVMDRIYADESWRIPVPERMYTISYKLRRNLSAVISLCLALFMLSFLYSVIDDSHRTEEVAFSFEGVMPVASAVASTGDEGAALGAKLKGVPVASISDPFILGNPIKTNPDYMVVVSLLGVVVALLIMNWFSKIKV